MLDIEFSSDSKYIPKEWLLVDRLCWQFHERSTKDLYRSHLTKQQFLGRLPRTDLLRDTERARGERGKNAQMAPVIWGLDLQELQWAKFKSSYMWNGDYHLRRTKFIVYQCALIFCVVSESLGTDVLSGESVTFHDH